MTLPAQLPANHLQQRIGQAANLATDVAEALHAYSDAVLEGGWGLVRIQEASDSLAKVNHTLINLLNCINDDDFRALGSL